MSYLIYWDKHAVVKAPSSANRCGTHGCRSLEAHTVKQRFVAIFRPRWRQKFTAHAAISFPRQATCLSRNSLASFSMWPSYKLVVRLIRPIFDKPKSVSLMCPMEVISRLFLQRESRHLHLINLMIFFFFLRVKTSNAHLSGLRSRCTIP